MPERLTMFTNILIEYFIPDHKWVEYEIEDVTLGELGFHGSNRYLTYKDDNDELIIMEINGLLDSYSGDTLLKDITVDQSKVITDLNTEGYGIVEYIEMSSNGWLIEPLSMEAYYSGDILYKVDIEDDLRVRCARMNMKDVSKRTLTIVGGVIHRSFVTDKKDSIIILGGFKTMSRFNGEVGGLYFKNETVINYVSHETVNLTYPNLSMTLTEDVPDGEIVNIVVGGRLILNHQLIINGKDLSIDLSTIGMDSYIDELSYVISGTKDRQECIDDLVSNINTFAFTVNANVTRLEEVHVTKTIKNDIFEVPTAISIPYANHNGNLINYIYKYNNKIEVRSITHNEVRRNESMKMDPNIDKVDTSTLKDKLTGLIIITE